MLTDMGDLPELEITDQAGPGASTQQFVFVDASEARMLPVQAGTDAAYRTVVQIQYRRQQQMELVERNGGVNRSEEHTSELQSLMRISYAVFCLKTKRNKLSKKETKNSGS